jgi:hypothetical protein
VAGQAGQLGAGRRLPALWRADRTAGFDDLVAVCQVGLGGTAKMELGKNYWDEMGQGDLAGVHTRLHADLVSRHRHADRARATQLPGGGARAGCARRAAGDLPLVAAGDGRRARAARAAGRPRCRLVLQAFDRLGAPEGAYPFYVEHAEVDPVHGKDWMDKAIEPLAAERPEWGPRMVKGRVVALARATWPSSPRCSRSSPPTGPGARLPDALGCSA